MFYDNYIRLCNSVDKSPSFVAEKIGLKKSSVTRWKNGSQPTDATLQKIASYFGVSVGFLVGDMEQKEKPTDTRAVSDEDIKFALFGEIGVSDEDYADVKRYAEFIRNKKKE